MTRAPWPVVAVNASRSESKRVIHTDLSCQHLTGTTRYRDARLYELRACAVCDMCANAYVVPDQDHGYQAALRQRAREGAE